MSFAEPLWQDDGMATIFRPFHAALCALLMFATGCLPGHAAEPGASGSKVVVVVLCVAEQSPERIEAALTTPFEEMLLRLPGVETLNSNTGHGSVEFELHFKGGATEDDAASVSLAIDRREAVFLSRTVRLDRPRADERFFSRNDCGKANA